ncbi:MAG: hypothetical protein MUF10_08600 [Thermoanaerobaculaceae bacterium]|jgi:hypothetical protein|nr:hypothetical protein [Thermoanaerobaculaceae bacterium]
MFGRSFGPIPVSPLSLPERVRGVLLALDRPDPGPYPAKLDTPVGAIARRLAGMTREEVGDVVREIELLGWLDIPYLRGPVTPRETGCPAAWLTADGLAILQELQKGAE